MSDDGFDENFTYNPGKGIERRIRHMPVVVDHITKKAEELVERTGSDNFKVVVQNRKNTTRARAYGAPANNVGIHEELSEHVLLKAAISLQGT